MPIGTKCSNCGSPVTEPTFGEPPYLCPRCEAASEECSPQRTFAEPAELADSNRTALVVLLSLIGGGAFLLAITLVVVGLVWSRVGDGDRDREVAVAEGDSKPVAVAGPPHQAMKKEREKVPEEVKPKFVQPGPVEPKPPIEPMVPAPLPMPMVPVFPRPFEPKPRPVEPAKPSLKIGRAHV